MNRKSLPPVGVIAEDDCDVDSVRVLIHRISGNAHISIRKFVGRGCGKIKRKCNAWASQLKDRGCVTLILVHDRDANDLMKLRDQIEQAIAPCPIDKHLICIPTEEFEAWLLSDPEAIRTSMNLRKKLKIKGWPEQINSPKEYLGHLIHYGSDGEKIYLNTKHNAKISEVLSFEKARRRCPSFVPFYEFIQKHM